MQQVAIPRYKNFFQKSYKSMIVLTDIFIVNRFSLLDLPLIMRQDHIRSFFNQYSYEMQKKYFQEIFDVPIVVD